MPEELKGNEKRSIVCSMRGGGQYNLRTFQDYHRSYDPLQYPLFFPFGTDGWTYDKFSYVTDDTKKVTAQQYVRWHSMERANIEPTIHLGQKLFQQWIVDQFTKIEMSRLKWICSNQKIIRADKYRNVVNSLNAGTIEETGRAQVILPATFTHGERFMKESYRDAMALVRVHGKPTLFITMTCNPQWDKIQAKLQQ